MTEAPSPQAPQQPEEPDYPTKMNKRELRKAVSDFREGILENRGCSDMMCMAVCAPLQALLGLMGVKTELREVEFPYTNHVYLEMADGIIIDPTADQFSGAWLKFPKVYIGPLPPIYSKWIAETSNP